MWVHQGPDDIAGIERGFKHFTHASFGRDRGCFGVLDAMENASKKIANASKKIATTSTGSSGRGTGGEGDNVVYFALTMKCLFALI